MELTPKKLRVKPPVLEDRVFTQIIWDFSVWKLSFLSHLFIWSFIQINIHWWIFILYIGLHCNTTTFTMLIKLFYFTLLKIGHYKFLQLVPLIGSHSFFYLFILNSSLLLANEILQAHLGYTSLQPWNQPFVQRSLVPLFREQY